MPGTLEDLSAHYELFPACSTSVVYNSPGPSAWGYTTHHSGLSSPTLIINQENTHPISMPKGQSDSNNTTLRLPRITQSCAKLAAGVHYENNLVIEVRKP